MLIPLGEIESTVKFFGENGFNNEGRKFLVGKLFKSLEKPEVCSHIHPNIIAFLNVKICFLFSEYDLNFESDVEVNLFIYGKFVKCEGLYFYKIIAYTEGTLLEEKNFWFYRKLYLNIYEGVGLPFVTFVNHFFNCIEFEE